jgi:hypothetical protein
MNDGNRLPLGAIWEESLAFARAEIGLLTPLALLGFGLPLVILELVQPAKLVDGNTVVTGPWMIWLIPHALLSMLGTLSISALALHPGMSVRESLAIALSRLPAGIGAALIGFALFVVLVTLVFGIAGVEIGPGGQLGPFSVAAFVGLLAVVVMVMVRALPIWAALAARPISPPAAIRTIFALTRGCYAKLLLVRITSWLAQLGVAIVLMTPIAIALTAIGGLLGVSAIGSLLGMVANSILIAAMMAFWTIYVARTYARLAASSSGI